jgi:integrase
MASIRKRGNVWQAQVRRKSSPSLYQSFPTKAEAQAWAREAEVSLDRGTPLVKQEALERITLGDLLRRYLREVVPHKKGYITEAYRIGFLLRRDISSLALEHLTPANIANYRDSRLKEVSSGTVRRELTVLRHCLEKARKEWSVSISSNPVAAIDKPKDSPARTRRLTEEDELRLAEGLKCTRNPLHKLAIQFAIETGMRRGEILKFCWRDLNTEHGSIYLQDTKNGYERHVPLSPKAMALVNSIPVGKAHEFVFPVSANALYLSWERLKRRSGIKNLRFHDLRHEAISRFFEMGLSMPEVSLISGHRDPRMLFRYTHLRATDLAEKLRRLSERETEQAADPPEET